MAELMTPAVVFARQYSVVLRFEIPEPTLPPELPVYASASIFVLAVAVGSISANG